MRVLALNKNGLMTYCTVEPALRGTGRCTHISHANEGETQEEFKERLKKAGMQFSENKIVETTDGLTAYVQNVKDPKDKAKLFKKTPNGYKLTEYGNYVVYSQAKLIFAAKIVELDKDCLYHRESVSEEYDKAKYNEERAKYKEQLDKLDKYMENYKIEHPEYYHEIEMVESPSRWISKYECEQEFTLEEAIQGYKYSSEQLNKIDKDKLPKIKSIRVMNEYKEIVDEARAKKRKALKIPTEEYFKSLGTVSVNKTRLALNRKASETNEQNKIFMQDIVGYIAEF